MRHVTGMHGGAEPFIGMPPVDPAILQTVPVGRGMVVEHALGGVQDIAAADPARSQLFQHIFEIGGGGLVAADILGRVDTVKRDTKFGMAVGKAGIVDVRENDKLIMLFQIGQRLG